MLLFLSYLLFAPLALASLRPRRPRLPKAPPSARVVERVSAVTGKAIPPIDTIYTFDQLVDHNNPGAGTFKQRYWVSQEFYAPGGPMVVFTPGESGVEGDSLYLDNGTMVGLIAQQQHGAMIEIEHRYYGLSSPVANLSAANLKYHTIDQAIEDLAYFAQNVHLPIPGGDQVSPSHAPWVLVGGSYSGALTAWTMVKKPGVFYAAYASSATVQNEVDSWQYFEPIRQNMPKNCSADVQAAIAHIDGILTGGNASAIASLYDLFGVSGLKHADDFAATLMDHVSAWQDLQPGFDPAEEDFFDFCDHLEVKNGTMAPAGGWGVDHAVAAWANYTKADYMQWDCGSDSPDDCLTTYDLSNPYWTNVTSPQDDRAYQWTLCSEEGFSSLSGAPAGSPTLVSRILTPSWDARMCQQYFPDAFGKDTLPAIVQANTNWVTKTNAAYGAAQIKANRLFLANGKQDPWRCETLSAPSLTIASTAQQPIALSNGFHCSDLLTYSGEVDSTILAVQKQGLAAIKGWLAGWKPASGKRGHAQPREAYSPRGHTW
ncbi:peptidase S28 [Artomyces pyxidatus]|uniref:Peptidase S28 n=1 Tax=Artomyces pyxidatus TaxID=48021 RepID=A0ACB8T469_9AGAM|nr:peptidase S28 [Artomyces pyxidatus]